MSRRFLLLASLLVFLAHLPLSFAQPFGSRLVLGGTDSPGYVEVPHAPELDPAASGAFTVELWLKLADSSSCRSLIGKNYGQSWWVGYCGRLRSYLGGGSSYWDSGDIEIGRWVHIAVTTDGTTRRHYVDGALTGTFTEPNPLGSSSDPLRIGSDPVYPYTPLAAIDEVRIWNVARTEEQIRSAMGAPLAAPPPGLVALWHLDGDARDSAGSHHGALFGAASFSGGLECFYPSYVPAAAHSPGAEGSSWVTDLVLTNPGSAAAPAEVSFLRQGEDNRSATSFDIEVPAGGSFPIPDVILERFGSDTGVGGLRVCSASKLKVSSRTYNRGVLGTYGQGIPGRSPASAVTVGKEAWLTGLFQTEGFRTNLGFQNTTGNAVVVTVDLRRSDGTPLGTRTISLAPYGQEQRNRIFQDVSVESVRNGIAVVNVDAGRVLAWASVVDNATGDGSYYEAE
jgi:hypothetical protein